MVTITCHVIHRVIYPRFVRKMASYDVAGTIYQALFQGDGRHEVRFHGRHAQHHGGVRNEITSLLACKHV